MFPEAGLWFLSIITKRISKNFLLAQYNVQRLMHVSLLVIWRMIFCASPQSFVYIGSFHPLTHSWSHTLWLDCTHLLYVCDWLQANSYPRYWSSEFRGEVKPPLLLFLQEYVHLKQKKEGRRRRRSRHLCLKLLGCLSGSNSHARWLTRSTPSPLAPNGWHTAVLHWQALCSCTHAKAASWRTALVSPAPDDSRRGSGWGGGGWWGEDWGRRCFTRSVVRLDFNNLPHLSHHCLYSCVNHI